MRCKNVKYYDRYFKKIYFEAFCFSKCKLVNRKISVPRKYI